MPLRRRETLARERPRQLARVGMAGVHCGGGPGRSVNRWRRLRRTRLQPFLGVPRRSHMQNLKATAPLPLILLALVKCSGAAQGGGGEVSSGISSSKALSELTAQEAASGCARMRDAVEAHLERASTKTALCTL